MLCAVCVCVFCVTRDSTQPGLHGAVLCLN